MSLLRPLSGQRSRQDIRSIGKRFGDELLADEVGFERIPPSRPRILPGDPASNGSKVLRRGLREVGDEPKPLEGVGFVVGAEQGGKGNDPARLSLIREEVT